MGLLLSFLFLIHSAHAETFSTLHTIEFFSGWKDEKGTLLLLTGFGPFGSVPDNPSGRIVHKLAEEIETRCPEGFLSPKSEKLPVRPGILNVLHPEKYAAIISMGVAESIGNIRVETAARNYYRDYQTGKHGLIDPKLPEYAVLKGGPLPPRMTIPASGFSVVLGDTTSAGTYVCNDTFFRACETIPGGSYFIHMPNVPRKDDDRLAAALGEIVCRIIEWREL